MRKSDYHYLLGLLKDNAGWDFDDDEYFIIDKKMYNFVRETGRRQSMMTTAGSFSSTISTTSSPSSASMTSKLRLAIILESSMRMMRESSAITHFAIYNTYSMLKPKPLSSIIFSFSLNLLKSSCK